VKIFIKIIVLLLAIDNQVSHAMILGKVVRGSKSSNRWFFRRGSKRKRGQRQRGHGYKHQRRFNSKSFGQKGSIWKEIAAGLGLVSGVSFGVVRGYKYYENHRETNIGDLLDVRTEEELLNVLSRLSKNDIELFLLHRNEFWSFLLPRNRKAAMICLLHKCDLYNVEILQDLLNEGLQLLLNSRSVEYRSEDYDLALELCKRGICNRKFIAIARIIEYPNIGALKAILDSEILDKKELEAFLKYARAEGARLQVHSKGYKYVNMHQGVYYKVDYTRLIDGDFTPTVKMVIKLLEEAISQS